MFERRGDELYWQHYLVARFLPNVGHAVTNEVEDALGVSAQSYDLIWPRIENRIADLGQQIGYLYQLSNRLASATEEVQPDLIELEASVTRLALSDHFTNLRLTAERLSNLLERLEGELFE